MLNKLLIFFTVLTLGVSAGCVTTTTNRHVDTEAAHDTRVQLGMQYLSVGRRDNARRQFSQALDLQRNSSEAYQGIALVHQGYGEMEAAGEAFRKAMRFATDKTRSDIQVSYGQYLMELNRDQEACRLFERSANDFDYQNRARALLFAGRCAERTGNSERAQAAYEHALNLNEHFAPALMELSEVYYRQGQFARAKRLLDRLEDVSQPTPRSLLLGIRIERTFGNKENEARYVNTLKTMYPYSKELLEYQSFYEGNK